MDKKKRRLSLFQVSKAKLVITSGLVIIMQYVLLTTLSSKIITQSGRLATELRLLIAAMSFVPLFLLTYIIISLVMKERIVKK